MEDILREHRQKQTIIKVLLIAATVSNLIYIAAVQRLL
jgi:hypothetical protein